jgi:ATP-dependent Clp protease ATP-binding subunit ClpA
LIQDKLKKPLAEAILFGDLSNGGGTVIVDVDQLQDDLIITVKAKETSTAV